MPKITGKLETITRTPSAVREVWLRPPSTRPGATGLIVDEPVRVIVDESGEFTADIAPGAGVLLLIGPAGMTREAIPLLVREGTKTLRQAVEEAKDFTPDVHDRLAELANETAENLEAARSLRADTDSAAQKMREAVQKAGVSAEGAARSEKAAGEHASKAGERAGEASAAQAAAEAARDKALTSEQAAGEHVKAAVQSVEQAAVHEQGAKAARSGIEGALAGAKDARTGAEKARDEARQAAESAIVGIKPDSVQKSMLAEDLRGEIDAKADSATVEKQLGEKANSADVDRKIGEIPRPTWEGLEGRPADFKPSAHTHATKEITGLDDALKAKADLSVVDEKIRAIPRPTWGELEGKPAKFPPEAHAHGIGDVNGLLEQLRGKASESDVSALRARMANLSFAIVDSLPSYPNHNTVYFVR
ncbi:hypothetical protein [Corynebacterium diphtheriae]|uniref:hypothetical protein n=1 Tax=Corynebacterium diphtheriae TaxID=1717 RepID=UPI0018C8EA38|nr:hypothetical protein [Corynebacterium diphtheriae]MBG9306427.1 hypothetical protein [Corynebacterium diphtheriae bv. mitis]